MKYLIITVLLLISTIAICKESKYEILARAARSPFSEELFIKCVYILCEQPEYVIAQSYHETGWFKSDNFRFRNNLFGMGLTKNNLASGKYGSYSVYDHWFMSLLDYAEWQKIFYKGGNYMYFLLFQRGYAEDPLYGKKVLAMKYCSEFKRRVERYRD